MVDGTHAVTGWTTAIGKQSRTDRAQALFEIESAYTFHLRREYHENAADIDTARFFKPMLAHKYEEFAPGYAQPKLDGIRCIARAEGLFTREGRPINGAPHIHLHLAPLFEADPDLILDGELYNHALKDDFNTIVSMVRRKVPDASHLEKSCELVQFHVYDLPSSPVAFGERMDTVTSLLDNLKAPTLVPVPTELIDSQQAYDAFHGQWIEQGYEGSMWRSDTVYEQKRTKMLRKRKDFSDEEYPCLEIREGEGNWAGLAKSVICQLPDGRTFGATIRGDKKRAAALLHETHRVVTVRYFHLTPDGIPRFPVVTKFWGEEREM
ncbi:hypothetical protein A9D14_18190 (plasmid) [Croceicoccus marinus]|uniref:Polydeoxyribonucleotide synthase [ATP] n=1 Tax=Croceicoccus marinus TaxID=450378 RepID=A0A217EYT0_9SPHN|nr:hypothetical protein A9D14_18190 [Croceicoccus marinus]